MKRKVKLFATIASLCLSLALMAFGVYAASAVTYKATGTVAYDLSEDVLCSITAVSGQGGDAAITAVSKVPEFTMADAVTNADFSVTTVGDAKSNEESPAVVKEYDFKDGTVVGVKVTVTNNNTKYKIKVTSATITLANNASNLSCAAAGSYENVEFAETQDMLFYVWINDLTAGIDGGSYTITIALAPGEAIA